MQFALDQRVHYHLNNPPKNTSFKTLSTIGLLTLGVGVGYPRIRLPHYGAGFPNLFTIYCISYLISCISRRSYNISCISRDHTTYLASLADHTTYLASLPEHTTYLVSLADHTTYLTSLPEHTTYLVSLSDHTTYLASLADHPTYPLSQIREWRISICVNLLLFLVETMIRSVSFNASMFSSHSAYPE